MPRISWINVALGVWLVVAAFALPHTGGDPIPQGVITGSFVAMAALWAAREPRVVAGQLASWTVALLGCWSAVGPFVLGSDRSRLTAANGVVVGLIIMALAGTNVWLRDRRARGTNVRV